MLVLAYHEDERYGIVLIRPIAVALAAMVLGAAQIPQTEAPTRTKFDAFDVATVKPVDPDANRGRLFRMDGPHRWLATDYTLKNLIALARVAALQH